jgi:hypothetical protein
MSKVSIIIPARAESELSVTRTLTSIYENATGEYEVIIGFDGIPPFPTQGLYSRYSYKERVMNLKMINFIDIVGIKTNINAMSAMATGKYIYKTDAHCSFSKGFDEILANDMQDDWIMMPRFYVLDSKTWEWQDDRFYDYFYLSCPFTDPRGFRFKAGGHWPERTKERLAIQIDDTPQIHGSGWMTTKDHFFELGGFPTIDPYGHAQEPIWLALKNQLNGSRVVVNKKAWYAHVHQDNSVKGFHYTREQEKVSYDIAANTFMKDPRMMGWIEKNMPMPTWPDDWKERYTKWLSEQ